MAKQKLVGKKAKIKATKVKELEAEIDEIREAKVDELNRIVPLIQKSMPTSLEMRCGGAIAQQKAFLFGRDKETHDLILKYQGLVKDLYPKANITLENIRPPSTIIFK